MLPGTAQKVCQGFLYALAGLAVVAIFAAGLVVLNFIHTAPRLDVNKLEVDYTSFIYAQTAEGQQEQEIVKLHDRQNRVWVGLKDIPPPMQNAMIATEDKRFWQHHGVDIRRTARAAAVYLFGGSSSFGGSTITQQLVKNLTGNDAVTLRRKVQEMWLAYRLERQIGKKRVLELYLNTVFFGEGAYGVRAAAYTYFDRDVSDLSLAQAASIAGITQFPQKYNPLLDAKANQVKQRVVLSEMLAQGYISEKEYEAALAEPLVFTTVSERGAAWRYPYFVDQVMDDVLADLQKEKGYSRAMASKLLYTGGLKIYATVDTQVQEALERVFADDINFPDDTSTGDKTNAAMIVIDPHTGEVKGVVGGRGEKKGMRTLNRATQSLRQPGSMIKPIAVYAPALDHMLIWPDTVFTDAPYTIEGWSPQNWYDGYWGNITVETAIEQSCNIVAVKVLELVGLERSFEFMRNNMGITTLVDKDERDGLFYTDKLYNALALGGLTDGVTVQEMAAAYGVFANRGIYVKPHTYSVVIGHDGETLLDKTGSSEAHIAVREQTAYSMTKLLEGVVRNGTGTVARLAVHMPVAGKTGTTSDEKDRWFVGYTPYYVGAVWFGYDMPKSMQHILAGRPNPAAVLWKKSMDIIHKGLPYKGFPELSWKEGDDGRGMLTLDGGKIYEGEIKEGMADGFGVMTYPNGDRYCGELAGNLRQGHGTLLYANGNRYEGEFSNDEINGTGTLSWANGDKYSGEWMNGKFSGQGTFTWISGDSYSGRWENEQFEGYGTFRWTNGNRYEGEWSAGAFNGQGAFYWADGDITQGEWKNGKHLP